MNSDAFQLDPVLAPFFQKIIKHWRFLLAATMIGATAGYGYSSFVPPTFVSSLVVRPALPSQTEELQIARLANGKINSNDIFQRFKRNVSSHDLQKSFLSASSTLAKLQSPTPPMFEKHSADGYDRKTRDYLKMETKWIFNNDTKLGLVKLFEPRALAFRIDADKKASRQYLLVQVEYSDKSVSADLLNKFTDFVNSSTVHQLVQEAYENINIRSENIGKYIDYKRHLFKILKKDRTTQLAEAAKIARSIDAKLPIQALSGNVTVEIEPPANLYRVPEEKEYPPLHFIDSATYLPLYQIAKTGQLEERVLNSNTPPLYFRGWAALEAELAALKKRQDDDPFIPHLRKLLQEQKWLSEIDIDQSTLSSIDRPTKLEISTASVNSSPVLTTSIGAFASFLISAGLLILTFAFQRGQNG